MLSIPSSLKASLRLGYDIVRLNLKIIFANKFIYFLAAAVGIYLLVTIIFLFNAEATMDEADIYGLMLVPGLLIIFYPTTFGIQNDVDTRMLEILFGVPNYRYKVWLVRLVLIYAVLIVFLWLLSLVSLLALTVFSPARMVFQLLFPILLLGSLAFMFSTLTRNGYGTAAIMVFLGFAMWISTDWLRESKYNIFLNPFDMPRNVNEVIWAQNIIDNRIYLAIGAFLAILAGLYRLQLREKFMR